MSGPGRTTPTRVDKAQNSDRGWRQRINVAGAANDADEWLAERRKRFPVREGA